MKTTILTLALLAGIQLTASATDLVIDRVVIKKHPIPTPYHASMSVKAGQEEGSFHEKKAYGSGGIDASEIEIRPHLTVKNVQLHSWATFTLHLDAKDSVVTTFKAQSKHTGRFEILSGSHDNMFVPALHNIPFVYRVYWHAR